ncbi:hypothetical protein VTK56DRAFT_1901 [Thermocarpiscus australiensis]
MSAKARMRRLPRVNCSCCYGAKYLLLCIMLRCIPRYYSRLCRLPAIERNGVRSPTSPREGRSVGRKTVRGIQLVASHALPTMRPCRTTPAHPKPALTGESRSVSEAVSLTIFLFFPPLPRLSSRPSFAELREGTSPEDPICQRWLRNDLIISSFKDAAPSANPTCRV